MAEDDNEETVADEPPAEPVDDAVPKNEKPASTKSRTEDAESERVADAGSEPERPAPPAEPAADAEPESGDSDATPAPAEPARAAAAPAAEEAAKPAAADPEPKPRPSGTTKLSGAPADVSPPPAAKPEPEPPPPPPMTNNADVQAFKLQFSGKAQQVADVQPDIPAFRLPASHVLDAARYLRDEQGYDHLACITAIDWKDRVEVVYNLWSYAKNRPFALRADAQGEPASVPSLTPLWEGADWLEREEYDLMGVVFDGHPDLRRILLPEGWQGHPLRKDYDLKHEQYVGMDADGNDVVHQEPREDAW